MRHLVFKWLFVCVSLFSFASAEEEPQAQAPAQTQTFALIKPQAVQDGHIGAIIQHIENAQLRPVAIKMIQLDRRKADAFYQEHRRKPFFKQLIAMITSGPSVAMVISGENAQEKLRSIVGATDPEQAERGTIRALYGTSITDNAIHASDSPESAEREIDLFFKPSEIYP